MKTAAFIPIKSYSSRVPGKNFRTWNGRPLYQWVILHAMEAGCFSDVFVDTDSEEVCEFGRANQCRIIHRMKEMASDHANGNDLIAHHHDLFPDYDAYFQLFATAPELKPETIAACVDEMAVQERLQQHDSIMSGAWVSGWYWLDALHPLYRPSILPRSQDWKGIWKESTGLYGIFREPLKRLRQRIGAMPVLHQIEACEMVDIDYPSDFPVEAA